MTARTAAILPAFLVAVSLSAAQPDGFNDGIDRTDPNFVTASLLVMSPGDELYSCAGHSCIRLECPKFNLDYCFSYESESVKDKVWEFFSGKLKMGMFSIPTAEYLKQYEKDGRGVNQYALNLPIGVKRHLWKLLDEKVAEGANLPYDYIKRGCSQFIVAILRKALAAENVTMEIPAWPAKYDLTRRELVERAVSRNYPWTRILLQSICGNYADKEVPKIEKVVTPSDVLDFLKAARVNGMPIIDGNGTVIHAVTRKDPTMPAITPWGVAWVAVTLSVFNLFLKRSYVDYGFLAFQSVMGLVLTYLVFLSDVPVTGWNWLLIPFNLLPLVFWKWRLKWALWFAIVLLLWDAWMICWPHQLTDPAYLVLVGAYIIFYLKFTSFGRVALLRDRIGRGTHPA